MQNLDEFKKRWTENKPQAVDAATLDHTTWQKLIRHRVNKQRNVSMKYFWASFVLQIIVYGFLSHVIIQNWQDTSVLLVSIFCFLLYIPFTVVLMRKFKRMAMLKSDDTHASGLAINDYVHQQHKLLVSFYRFKKKYELILVPTSSIILIWVTFRLYVPGGVLAYPTAAIGLLLLTLGSCLVAILAENKRNFKEPIAQLEEILKDMDDKV